MIQHMNNTLVKHNKVFFSVLLFIIIIGFVMFFGAMDPTSFFGELFGGSRNTLGKVADKEDVTIDDINEVRKKAQLLSAINPNFANNVSAENLFYLSAFEKLARINGIAVSDKELQDAIAQISLFNGEDGKFSPAKYKEFTDSLAKHYQATATDFEEAYRMYLSILNFQLSAVDGVSVSNNEIDEALNSLNLTATFQTITFPAKNFEKDIKVDEKEIRDFYEKNKSYYEESVALIISVKANTKDIKIDDKELEEAKKSGLYEGKTDAEIKEILKAPKALNAAKDKITAFRKNELMATLDNEFFKKDPEKYIKTLLAENSEKFSGFEPWVTAPLSQKSPKITGLEENTIAEICKIRIEGGFTKVIEQEDSCLVAIMLKKQEPAENTLKNVIYPEIKDIRAKSKMHEMVNAKANEFVNAAKDGKITAENLVEKAKEFGAIPGEIKTANMLDEVNKQLTMFENLPSEGDSAQNKDQMAEMLGRQLAPNLVSPAPSKNFCMGPFSSQTSMGDVEVSFCTNCVSVDGFKVSDFTRNVIKNAILTNKRQMAAINFNKWAEKQIQRYMTEEEKQQLAEQQGSAGE